VYNDKNYSNYDSNYNDNYSEKYNKVKKKNKKNKFSKKNDYKNIEGIFDYENKYYSSDEIEKEKFIKNKYNQNDDDNYNDDDIIIVTENKNCKGNNLFWNLNKKNNIENNNIDVNNGGNCGLKKSKSLHEKDFLLGKNNLIRKIKFRK
jgi:hypothetical protein